MFSTDKSVLFTFIDIGTESSSEGISRIAQALKTRGSVDAITIETGIAVYSAFVNVNASPVGESKSI